MQACAKNNFHDDVKTFAAKKAHSVFLTE